MGAPVKNLNAADETSVEALLTSLKTIDPAERRRHASVFNYWLSIRGARQFPAIRDLDPLEISDAGPSSVLVEIIGGGDDAEIRHLGQAIRAGVSVNRISEVAVPSLLACIHAQLRVVAACGQAHAFEDQFETEDGPRRCWVTLLPLSSNGTWIDFIYGYVSLDNDAEPEAGAPEPATPKPDEAAVDAAAPPADEADPFKVELHPYDDPAEAREPEPGPEAIAEPEADPEYEPEPEPENDPEPQPERAGRAGFSSKLFEGLASVSGFYGKANHAAAPEPEEWAEPEEAADPGEWAEPEAAAAAEPQQWDEPGEAEPETEPASFDQSETAEAAPPVAHMEGSLQEKLSDVRAMAEEARQAQERSNLALYHGLSAAYDFALDAEDEPEDYLRLVETQGLKIQLRSPMKPVVKLAFAGLCDDSTIAQLEAVLAWALKMDLPRGSLAERIQAEGGIGQILAATRA